MRLPRDIRHFLGWYLNPRGRMKRFGFNTALFLAFIPVLVIQINQGMAFVEKASTSAMPLMEVVNSLHLLGDTSSDAETGQITQRKSVQNALKGLQDFEEIFGGKKESGFQIPWVNIVAFLTYLALLPLVQMRLRDMGKGEKRDLYFWTGLVYAGVVAAALKAFGFSPFGIFSFLLAAVSFITLAWLSMAQGKIYIPPSERFGPGVKPQNKDKDIF